MRALCPSPGHTSPQFINTQRAPHPSFTHLPHPEPHLVPPFRPPPPTAAGRGQREPHLLHRGLGRHLPERPAPLVPAAWVFRAALGGGGQPRPRRRAGGAPLGLHEVRHWCRRLLRWLLPVLRVLTALPVPTALPCRWKEQFFVTRGSECRLSIAGAGSGCGPAAVGRRCLMRAVCGVPGSAAPSNPLPQFHLQASTTSPSTARRGRWLGSTSTPPPHQTRRSPWAWRAPARRASPLPPSRWREAACVQSAGAPPPPPPPSLDEAIPLDQAVMLNLAPLATATVDPLPHLLATLAGPGVVAPGSLCPPACLPVLDRLCHRRCHRPPHPQEPLRTREGK